MNINTVILGGNLTADPDLKYLPSGSAACEFTVAINEVWYNDAKEKQEKAHFIRCYCFGKTAENIAKYFAKGQRIVVEGSLAQDSWEDKETGKKREKTRVKVSDFHFVDSAKKREEQPAQSQAKANDDGDNVPF